MKTYFFMRLNRKVKRGASFKIWKIDRNCRKVTTLWGRAEQVRSKVTARGTLQSKTRSFSTLEKAAAHETSRIASKLAKGYERTPRVSR
jgi:predicted DNA-binding WGR domain protein